MTKTVSEALGNNSIKFYINVFRTDTTKELDKIRQLKNNILKQ